MTQPAISAEQASMFERCISAGGVAVFPSDTVYGLACDPGDQAAFDRLYALKGRAPVKPSAVMLFQVDPALELLTGLGPRTQGAAARLLPGPVTLILPNPGGLFPLACGPDPGTLGLRVPALPPALQALEGVRVPILQSSANVAGGPEARVLADVPEQLRSSADVVLDGGELPGTASTVVDLRDYETGGSWSVLRHGALADELVAEALA